MIHKELQVLLKELDYYRFSNFDVDKIEEIEEKIKAYGEKENIIGDTPNTSYIAYPSYSDNDFYGKLYRKKEFNKTIVPPISTQMSYDEITNSKCSSNFRITNNQIFLKNFLSPSTHYNGILMYHGVGVGKCFRYDTEILMYDGTIKHVQDIVVGDKVMGDDSFPRTVLSLSKPAMSNLFTIKQRYGATYAVNSEHVLTLLYKGKKIDMAIKDYISLSDEEKQQYQGCRSGIIYFQNQKQSFTLEQSKQIGTLHSYYMLHDSVKYANPLTRGAFLAGYIDIWGKIVHGKLSIPWNEEVVFVARSLSIGTEMYIHEATRSIHVKLDGNMLKHIPFSVFDLSKVNIESKYHFLTITQNFHSEKYYGFEVDGNHRFLLGDFTVTHNSCSAISIAEQFMNVFDKRVLALMPSNLKENFKKQIFDINKGAQCTWNKYRNMLGDDGLASSDVLEKRANRIINDSYQFLGFQEFANAIIRMRDSLQNETRFISYIKEQFSNRVIIIDEVHNVREGEDGLDKIVTPILLQVIQNAENVKLILLSATPMFNEASEIVWLINLLLANDKRPLLQQSEIFSNDGKLTEQGMTKLATAAKGYISYMQGENPFSFPFRLYPSINNDPNIQKTPPKYDIKGQLIPKPSRLSKLELIQSNMSKLQYKLLSGENIGDYDQTNTQLVQISNIVYPNNNYGAAGIKNSFNKISNFYSYKAGVPQFLSQEYINEYAPKIKRIVDYIRKSKGICFVYSFFIDSGIIPIAMALEHIGFVRYNGSNLLTGITPPPKPFIINGRQACYSIISARKELTPDFDRDIDIARSEKNANGELIKVILGTSVSAEGIDFKCIREMHMLDPWYHLNKMEQIFGRGIRNCSHIQLPPSMRNVTLYHHICINKESQNESIDERIYRIAENKQIHIDQVENLLRSIAVDCHLNQNMFATTDISIDIESSQGTLIKKHPIQPKRFKGANKCKDVINPLPIDLSTFNKHFYATEIDDMAIYIATIFVKKHFATYKEIKKELPNADQDVLMYALDFMLETRYIVHHGTNEVPGYLIYRSNIYLFQPRVSNDVTMPLASRYQYQSKKINTLAIKASTITKIDEVNSNTISVIDTVEAEVAALQATYNDFDFPKQIFYDFVIDRLEWKQVFEIATNKSISAGIQTALVGAQILLVDLPWVRNIFVTDVEYYNKDTKLKITLREYQNVSNTLDIKKLNISTLKGYVDITKKPPKFKILDSEKTRSMGYVCAATSTLKIDELKKMIQPLKAAVDTKKPMLCDIYELKLRTDNVCFARPYDARLSLGLKIKATL